MSGYLRMMRYPDVRHKVGCTASTLVFVDLGELVSGALAFCDQYTPVHKRQSYSYDQDVIVAEIRRRVPITEMMIGECKVFMINRKKFHKVLGACRHSYRTGFLGRGFPSHSR